MLYEMIAGHAPFECALAGETIAAILEREPAPLEAPRTANRRTEDPELERLTFCLLGVALPSDLIRDTRTTPFNIGQRIELQDFTDAEATPLARGLGRAEPMAAKLLKRILYWTGGHPYLTQRLRQAVAEDASVHAEQDL